LPGKNLTFRESNHTDPAGKGNWHPPGKNGQFVTGQQREPAKSLQEESKKGIRRVSSDSFSFVSNQSVFQLSPELIDEFPNFRELFEDFLQIIEPDLIRAV